MSSAITQVKKLRAEQELIQIGERLRSGMTGMSDSMPLARMDAEARNGPADGMARMIGLRLPEDFRLCAGEMNEGRVEITIHGADRFDLSFTQPPGKILVNKAPFAMSRSVAFVREQSGWRLSDRDYKD